MKPCLSIVLPLLLLLFSEKSDQAYGQQIIFNKVLPPDGKTFEHVTGITQDVMGFMWFATKKGLYSYDGYQMTPYTNNPLNPNTLISNSLESVYADLNGNIWIGSLGAGLDCLDPATGIFKHFLHNAKDPASLSNDTVTVILRDKQ